MAALEDLKPGVRARGLVAGQTVEVIAATWHGSDTLEVVYRAPDGSLGGRVLNRADEERLTVVAEAERWPLDADGDLFKLASEARRIQLAHLFDPFVGVETAAIDPLPHQIEAVYQRMLPVQPLRFLLADDPGAGKTIMAGLYLRELIIRGDVERCLIIAPGSLVEQWQDEMWQRFTLPFSILSRAMVEEARTGNPFTEQNLLIARMDQVARSEDLTARLEASEWDLVVVDEAHKMSAHCYGGEVDETWRFRLGKRLGSITRHLLLLTATPHSGKPEDFQLFLTLLDAERFVGGCGRQHQGVPPEFSDLMRRYVKESLVTFEGKPLFPERRATTVNYELSPLEDGLYQAVTEYVRTGMNAADRLAKGEGVERKRGLVVGFALTALQRRLASSPEAIFRSLQRRRQRLERRRAELEAALRTGVERPADPLAGVSESALEEFDADDYGDVELEEIENEAIDQATAAATLGELADEIGQLHTLERLADAVRQAGTDRKWEELSGILQSDQLAADDGAKRKLIVFSEHRDTLHYLEGRIRSLLGQPEAVVAIHGGLRRDDRRRIQDAFINDPGVQVLVATDAAGEGVNLQRANLMVNYDLPWNPNRIEQRFGRIHRIGQHEVCHLWNLVAYQTREGQVFQRLFTKIEEMRKALGDTVYDVLGDAEINRCLADLLVEAIRYGEQPEVRARMEQVIDRDIGTRLQQVLDERALSADLLSQLQVQAIRNAMERAKARRLQPGFIQAFFKEALDQLGGRIVEREPGRFEITRVPAPVRSRSREIAVGAPLHSTYERVTFTRDRVHVTGKPDAALLAPGHPLLAALVDTTLGRHGDLLQRGTVLVDPDDPSETPRVLVYLEHSVHDSRPGDRPVSRRFAFVEISRDGATRNPGPEPYLLYRAATEDEHPLFQPEAEAEWVTQALGEQARSHAIAHLAGPHYEEVRELSTARVERVRQAVQQRLNAEIQHWDARAAELKAKELQGKKGPGGMTSGHARARADDLEARRDRRLRQLDQEADLSNRPPVVVAGALIIPQGLLDRLAGRRDKPEQDYVKDVTEVERRAVDAVLAAERTLGREPREMAHDNPGYDIESTDTRTGRVYFIEVKGRLQGETEVNVKVRQVRMANNNPDTFRLALVVVPYDGGAQCPVRYVLRPFEGWEPHFAQVSVPLDLSKMLALSVEPQ